MSIRKELFEKYMNEPMSFIYKDNLKKIATLDKIYVLTNIPTTPTIIPIKDTDWVAMQVFETMDLANDYIKSNKLEGYFNINPMEVTSFLYLTEKLFYKGVTGIIYNFNYKNNVNAVYYPLYKLLENIDNTLVKNDNEEIVKILLNALYKNNYLNTIYHPTLNADEIGIGIIRYVIRYDGVNEFIDMFTTREVAEQYCKKNGIEKNLEDNCKKIIKDKKDNLEVLKEIGSDAKAEIYPITTVMNDVLFYSINILLEKEQEKINKLNSNKPKTFSLKKFDFDESNGEVKFIKSKYKVKIHTEKKVYSIDMDDFMRLIINVGFKQIDLG